MPQRRPIVSVDKGRFFSEEEICLWNYVSHHKFLHFYLICILEMEEESWILSIAMPGNIKTPKIDRNTKILEDLGAVVLVITNVLESFGNDLKQLKENT